MEENSVTYRPMTVGNILDYTFQVYRKNFLMILGFSALVGGLFNLLNLWVANMAAPPGVTLNPWMGILESLQTGNIDSIVGNPQVIPEMNTNPMEWMQRFFLFQGIVWLMSLLYGVFIHPFVQGGIMGVTHQYAHGVKLDMNGAFGLTLKKFWRLVVTGLCLALYYLGIGIVAAIVIVICMVPLTAMGFIMGSNPTGSSIAGFIVLLIAIFLIILLAVVTAQIFISFTYPVVMAEEVFHFNAMGRSFKLVGKKFWKVLGTTLLIGLIMGIMILLLGILAIISAAFSMNPMMAEQVIAFLMVSLIMPIGYIASMVLYMDVRRQVENS